MTAQQVKFIAPKKVSAPTAPLKIGNQFALELFSSSIVLIIFFMLSGATFFWDKEGQPLFSASRYPVITFSALATASLIYLRIKGIALRITPLAGAIGLLVLFFSDWLLRSHSFFPGPGIRGELILYTLILLPLIRYSERIIKAVAIAAPILLLWCFLTEASGRLLLSDDHASVLFRLLSLKNNFPYIPNFNTLWNAGMDSRDYFGTGILNLYFITWPFTLFFELPNFYTYLVAAIVLVVLPACTYFGARQLKSSQLAAASASILSLSSSLVWFRWSLKYGAMGFVTTSAFLPLVFALSLRYVDPNERLTGRFALFYLLITSLALFWPLCAVSLAILGLAALFSIRSLASKRHFALVICGLLAVNLPWMTIFWRVSKLEQFVNVNKVVTPSESEALLQQDAPPSPKLIWEPNRVRKSKGPAGIDGGVTRIRDLASATNPLIFLFALPGLFLIPSRRSRILLGLSLLWLIFLGGFVAQVQPQYELERMLVVASFLMTIPAGLALGALIEGLKTKSSPLYNLLSSVSIAFLALGIWVSGSIVQNRSVERISFGDSTVAKLIELIKSNSGQGRTAFFGFSLHELSGGHFAPLAFFTGKPLLASVPTHSRWDYADLIPEEFLVDQHSGVQRYLDYMNVSLISAHEPGWKDYLRTNPDSYTKVGEVGNFSLYKRDNYSSNYFLEGSGQVLNQDSSSVRLTTDTDRAVIKFNYYPYLISDNCKLTPKRISQSIEFLELTDCIPKKETTIKFMAPWNRALLQTPPHL